MKKFYPPACVMRIFNLLFIILLLGNGSALAQKYGYSYVNLTKKTVGGTVEPGDILEIRYSVLFPWGFNPSGNRRVYNVRYFDYVPTNTQMLTSSTDSIRIITNEGLTHRKYTLASGDDAAIYVAPTPTSTYYNIRINIGTGAGNATNTNITPLTGGGQINLINSTSGDQPKWWTGHLFSTSFRVRVTGNYSDTISLGGGRLYYTMSTSASNPRFMEVPKFKILVSRNESLCANATGANFLGEFGGSFGTGTGLNRVAAPEYTNPNYTFINNVSAAVMVNDGSYAIVNNTSPRSGTNTNAQRVPNCTGTPIANDNCNNRMFNGQWDIIGDHTGQSTAASNPPPSGTTQSGYMLMVNADYVTSEAYKQTITGLCANTTYEFSAWFRNICPTCGATANLQATNQPGVLPNLTFVLDGIDHYSTGEIAYDPSGNWVKKGFSFTTGANQSAITLSIRNNAQGGGGNDWVMDDISLATCQPNLVMKPYGNAVVCYGNPIQFSADIQSYFSNYTHYQWERSTDSGATWVKSAAAVGSPVLTNGQYMYTVDYPGFIGDSSSHGDIIRLRVATTADNLLGDECSFLANTNVVVMVNNCGEVLDADLVQFKAQLVSAGVSLRWTSVNEVRGMNYIIEKSSDRLNWQRIQTLPAKAISNRNDYSILDPGSIQKEMYYRIRMVQNDKFKFSDVLLVKPENNRRSFTIKAIQNPFQNHLPVEVTLPAGGEINLFLFDLYGKVQKQISARVTAGINHVSLTETGSMPAGTYILVARYNDQIQQKKVLKTNQ